MNKFKKISIFAIMLTVGLSLSACGVGDTSNSQNNNVTGEKNKKETYQTINGSSNEYGGVIKDGKYLTGKARGLTADQNGNMNNTKSFETGLQDISKKEFSPSKYTFQEGQYLSSDTLQSWLNRKSKDNADGLNPKDNGSKNEKKRNPIYLESIEEQDYMQKSGNAMKLKGVTIGLAMNSVDYYQKEQYGAEYQTKISNDEINTKSNEIAQEVVSRMRKDKDLKNVPIVVAVYKQAPNDSLIGGTFLKYAKTNGSSISEWKDLDYKNVVYPLGNGESSPNANDASAFNNFKNQTQSFFPNLSGITAQAQYKGKEMQGMRINITTQFYSETEIQNFTQFVSTQAQKYLPTGVNIDITVKSNNDVQSFLSRGTKDKSFTSHVFTSY